MAAARCYSVNLWQGNKYSALLPTKRNGRTQGQFIYHSKPWAWSFLFNFSRRGVDVFAAPLPGEHLGSQITPLPPLPEPPASSPSIQQSSKCDRCGEKKSNTSICGIQSNVMWETKEINTVILVNPLNCLLRESLKVSIQTAAADGCSISQRIQSISQHINL